MIRARHCRLFGLLAGLLVFGVTALRAHNVFQSTTTARLHPDALELEVTLARTSAAAAAIPGPDIVLLDPLNFAQYRPALVQGASRLFEVNQADAPLAVRSSSAQLTADGDVVFTLHYARPAAGPLHFRATHVVQLGRDYSSSFTFLPRDAAPPLVKLLSAADAEFEITLTAAGGVTGPPPAAAGAFLRLGIEHILTGYDHLLFLAGLLVVCRRLRTMVGIITCFTLAHSLTLALAALQVFSLSPRIVEPLIAASIVFVGVENLVRKEEPRGRWALTFAFGLIHGFGFAGVLEEIGLRGSPGAIAGPLFAFNLRVELGQLAVMAALLPLLLWWRRRPFYERVAQPAASTIVAAAGAVWLLQRTLFG